MRARGPWAAANWYDDAASPRKTKVPVLVGAIVSRMKSVFDVATDLAKAHKHEDPETDEVYLAVTPESATEVRLVEISGSLGNSGEVLPFRFAPRADLGVPYASVVVLLGREDWERVKRGELSLPTGWGQPQDLKKIA